MSVFYTKCGKKFNKNTNAATTGYECDTDEFGDLVKKCKGCSFSKIKYKGEVVVYECRAGSKPPNHMNTITGNLDDMNAIRIFSLNLGLMKFIYDYAEKEPELVPYWCKDSDDCRKVISITCSKNKKGIAAKKELIGWFFGDGGFKSSGIDLSCLERD
ncbi:MAG: hypothetical protein PHS04_14445 [Tissierellia bacterium]|nr:hypothetical protein [Tissierellia bacterium]